MNGTRTEIAESQAELTHVCIYLFACFAISSVFTFVRGSLFTLSGERLVARFRKACFNSMVIKDIEFFDRTQSGELVNRLASDTAAVQDALTVNISMALRYVAQALVGLIILFVLSPALTGVMLLVVPVVAIGASFYGRFVRNISEAYQKALASSGEVAGEVFGAIRTVRSFAAEEREMQRYAASIDTSYEAGAKRSWAYGAFAGGIGLAAYSAVTVVLWVGGSEVIRGTLDPGTLIAFLLYTVYISGAFGVLSGLYGTLMKAVGSAERIFEILDDVPKINTTGGIRPPRSAFSGTVEFRNISFAYPMRPDVRVLSKFSLRCQAGEKVALVGPSGAGKSTVMALLQRFYDVDATQGVSIDVGGYPPKSLDPAWLRSKNAGLALVSQEPTLFATTIRDNLCYGGAFTEEEIIDAAKKANAHSFISEFPEGYATVVGERGIQLSGGQKQRCAIARAILMDPMFLLLDEATSALDAESEFLVQQALQLLMKGRTTIVIAHRRAQFVMRIRSSSWIRDAFKRLARTKNC